MFKGRVELVQLVLVQVSHGGDPGQVHALLECDFLEIGFVGNRFEVDAVGLRGHHHLGQGQQLGHVILRLLGQRQVPVVGRQAELLVALDGPADASFTRIVGGQGE
ncbi:hypothetical protein D3C78_1743450 [compost metagenome]